MSLTNPTARELDLEARIAQLERDLKICAEERKDARYAEKHNTQMWMEVAQEAELDRKAERLARLEFQKRVEELEQKLGAS